MFSSCQVSLGGEVERGRQPDMNSDVNMDTKMDTGNSIALQCSSCDAPIFSCWCLDCREALCEVCVSAHRRVSITRSHRLLDQPPAGLSCHTFGSQRDVSTHPIKFCRLHPSEPLKLFCFTCNQYTCRDCQLMTHMNHRYEFVSEVLASLRRQLEDRAQKVAAQRDSVKKALRDIETRLQDIVQYKLSLKTELMQSYSVLLKLMEKRMQELIKDVEKVYSLECEQLQSRAEKLMQLQQSQESVTETAVKARKSKDLLALLAYKAQIESQMKNLYDQDLSPPKTMAQIKIVTDRTTVETILNFGQLDISWIPFTVLQTYNLSPCPPATSTSAITSLKPISPAPTYSIQTETSNKPSSAAPVTFFMCSSNSSSFSTTTTTSPIPIKPAPTYSLQTGTSTNPSSAAPVTIFMCYSTSSSTSSSAAPPSYTSAAPSLKPLPQSGDIRNNSPVALKSSQICLPLSSSSSFCAAPPAFTSPFSLPQTTLVSDSFLYVVKKHLPSIQKSLGTHFALHPPSTITCAANTCNITQTRTSSDSVLPAPPQTLVLQHLPSSSSSLSPTCTTPASPHLNPVLFTPSIQPVVATTFSHQETNLGKSTKTVSASSSYHSTPSCAVPTLIPQPGVLDKLPTLSQNQLPVVLNNTVSGFPVSLPSAAPQLVLQTSTCSKQQKQCANPGQVVTADPNCEATLNHSQTQENQSSARPQSSDIGSDSSSLKQDLHHQVVKAVADSACDRSIQQVETKQQEPMENEPTSTMCEEPEPAPDSGPKESVIKQEDCRLSQWQPKVHLFRLPVSPSTPGRPLRGFRLVPGDTEDEIYLEEMSEDSQSCVDGVSCGDLSEPPSSPESPVTLQMVSCSACGSANGSIICISCGRGFHRGCHVPPIGLDIWSEWSCSLCQDLSDPSDPYSTERPEVPSLSLLEQRRCESLLLYLKVEGHSQLSQSHLKLISERLTLCGSPPYETAAEFLFDVWSLFRDASSSQDDLLNKLQQNYHLRLEETFGPEIPRPPPPDRRRPFKETSTETRLRDTRKRLSQFLTMMGSPGAKRIKGDSVVQRDGQ